MLRKIRNPRRRLQRSRRTDAGALEIPCNRPAPARIPWPNRPCGRRYAE